MKTREEILPLTHYGRLGVDRNASDTEIRDAYKKLSRFYHPDKLSELEKKRYGDVFPLLGHAHEILTDPVKKSQYDQTLPQANSEAEPARAFMNSSAYSQPLKKRKIITVYEMRSSEHNSALLDQNITKDKLASLFGNVNHDVRFLDRYPLEVAAEYNNIHAVKLLLELGADVNCPVDTGSPLRSGALLQAVEKQNVEILRLLIQQPLLQVNVRFENYSGVQSTPLTKAIELGNEEIVTLLLDNGADPNFESSTPPLALALLSEKPKIANRLIEHGADITQAKTALDKLFLGAVMQLIDVEMRYIKASNLFDSTITKKTGALKEKFASNEITDRVWEALLSRVNAINISDILNPKAVDPLAMLTKVFTHMAGVIHFRKALDHITLIEMQDRDDIQLVNASRLGGLVEVLGKHIISPPAPNMILLNSDAKMEFVYAINKKDRTFESVKSALISYISQVDSFINTQDKEHLRATLSTYLGVPMKSGMRQVIASLSIEKLPTPELNLNQAPSAAKVRGNEASQSTATWKSNLDKATKEPDNTPAGRRPN